MADYQYVTSHGVIVPDTSTLIDEATAEFQAALGVDIIADPETPEGALIVARAATMRAVVENNAALANQINPNYAGGSFLDAIWALSGGSRKLATYSVAVCTLTGQVGTIVGTSVRFRSEGGNYWAVVDPVTLGADPVNVNVRCTIAGPVTAAANTINQIYVGAIGLETVTNPAAASAGTEPQSDASARSDRRKQIGLQGVNMPVSVTSKLYALTGTKSLSFRENRSNSPLVISPTITMVAHSIYVCVDNFTNTDEDIAGALLYNTAGCGFNGSINVTVNGTVVKFDRPTLVPIQARITCRVTNPLIDPQTSVRAAILAYANGEIDGEDGFVVDGDVSAFELAGAINAQYPNIYVVKAEIALVSDGIYSTDEIAIPVNKKATITESAITVLVV